MSRPKKKKTTVREAVKSQLEKIFFEYEDEMSALGWRTDTAGARAGKRFFMVVIRELLVEIYKLKSKK